MRLLYFDKLSMYRRLCYLHTGYNRALTALCFLVMDYIIEKKINRHNILQYCLLWIFYRTEINEMKKLHSFYACSLDNTWEKGSSPGW